MRNTGDAQWWSFTAPAAGTYTVRLSDLPAAYRLSAYYPGGGRSTYSSSLSDRVITRTLSAGQRIVVSVAAVNANGNVNDPYRLSVIDESTGGSVMGASMVSADRWAQLLG